MDCVWLQTPKAKRTKAKGSGQLTRDEEEDKRCAMIADRVMERQTSQREGGREGVRNGTCFMDCVERK